MQVKGALIGGVAAALALVGCSSGSGARTARSVSSSLATSPSTSPHPVVGGTVLPLSPDTPSPSSTGSAASSPAKTSAPPAVAAPTVQPTSASPYGAHVQLNRTSAAGAKTVTLTSQVTGRVAQLYSSHDQTLIPGTEQTLRTKVTFGDGQGESGSDGGDVTCRNGTPAVPLSENGNWSYTYKTPGTYLVTFQTWACLPASATAPSSADVQATLVSAVLRVTVSS